MLKKSAKKIAFIMTALAVTSTCNNVVLNPLVSANAVNSAKTSISTNFISKKDNPDLKTLASSLGADTNYLNVPAYDLSEKYYLEDLFSENGLTTGKMWRNKILADYAKQSALGNTDVCYDDLMLNQFNAKSGGKMSIGISLVQTLAHNGLFSPSDIKSNAENLCDISLDDEVERILWNYQMTPSYFNTALYNTFEKTSFTTKEKLQKIIDASENAVKNGKYFTVMAEIGKYESYAVTGIGYADGNWTFNGVSYNKCILTLDPDSTDENGNPIGFDEEHCIYINTETNQYCIPAHNWTSENDLIIYALTDDKLLNSQGFINPTSDFDTDLSDMNIIRIINNSNKYEPSNIFVTDADGNENKIDDSIISNNYRISAKGTKFRFENYYEGFMQNQRTYCTGIIDKENSTIELSDNNVSITNTNLENDSAEFTIFMKSKDSNKNDFFVSGNTSGDVYVEAVDDGYILGANQKVECHLGLDKLNRNGQADNNELFEDEAVITTSNNLLVKLNENNEKLFFIDSDNDGVYETQLTKGDANSDGKIDASDASAILAGYASASTNKTNFINKDFGDYNNDGKIDASDASAVLEYYAKISSGVKE